MILPTVDPETAVAQGAAIQASIVADATGIDVAAVELQGTSRRDLCYAEDADVDDV